MIHDKERIELALLGYRAGVYEWNLLDNSAYYSPQWKEMLGYAGTDDFPAALSAWQERVHPDDIDAVLENVQATLYAKKEYIEAIHRLKHKDGKWIWILGRGMIQYDDEGEAIRMVGIHTDITKIKEHENFIKEQQKFLQSVINGINDPVIVIGKDYGVQLMNTAVRRQMDLSKIADPEQPKCYELSHHRVTPCDNDVEHPCPLKRVRESKQHVTCMHDHVDDNGNKMYIELSATPLFDEEGEFIGIIETSRDMTVHLSLQHELKKQRDTLHHQAHHDSLTLLPNSTLFKDRLRKSIERVRHHEIGLSVFFIDLDHFKKVNDTFGHDTGDFVLNAVADRLKSTIRKEDTVARLGGDEFVMILENMITVNDASVLAKKILAAFETPIFYKDKAIDISLSIGISMYPKDAGNIDELLAYSDKAMYKVKESGRNNFQFYHK